MSLEEMTKIAKELQIPEAARQQTQPRGLQNYTISSCTWFSKVLGRMLRKDKFILSKECCCPSKKVSLLSG